MITRWWCLLCRRFNLAVFALCYRYFVNKATTELLCKTNAINRLLMLSVLFAIASCTFNARKPGQYFNDECPTFYMSIAPSFSHPFEYEITSVVLVVREYSGLGGYNWGRRKEVARVKVTPQQEKDIRQMSMAAITQSIVEANEVEDIIVLDGTSWYVLSDTDMDSGPFLACSTNNPGDTFYKLHNYMKTLITDKQSKN